MDDMASVIMLCLFCILPFSIMHSRWGLESYLFFPMCIFSLSALWKAIDSNSNRWYFITGILFGIALYTYAISYLIVPFFLLLSFVYCVKINAIKYKQIVILAIPLLVLSFPLILMICVQNNIIDEIVTPFFSIPKLPEYRAGEIGFHHIAQNLKDVFHRLFIEDGLEGNAMPEYGTLYLVSIPILLWGMICCLRDSIKSLAERTPGLDFIMMIFLVVASCITLMLYSPNINKANELFIPFFYFLCRGIYDIYAKSKYAVVSIVICYLFSFMFFVHAYFSYYTQQNKSGLYFVSIEELRNAIEFAESLDRENIYVLGKLQPKAYYMLSQGKSLVEEDDNEGRYRFKSETGPSHDNAYICLEVGAFPGRYDDPEYNIEWFDEISVYY